MNYIIPLLSTLLGASIGVSIKLWADVQILKDWRNSHTSEHNHREIAMEKTIDNIFKEIKELSSNLNQIIGNLKND